MKWLNNLFFFGSLKRKQILINPSLQLSVINYVLFLFVVVLIVFYAANSYFIYLLQQKGIAAGLSSGSEYFIFLSDCKLLLNYILLGLSVILIFIIYYFGLRLSHRLAGPIYKIDKTLDAIMQSKTNETIRLREKDYYKEHAQKINDYILFKSNH